MEQLYRDLLEENLSGMDDESKKGWSTERRNDLVAPLLCGMATVEALDGIAYALEGIRDAIDAQRPAGPEPEEALAEEIRIELHRRIGHLGAPQARIALRGMVSGQSLKDAIDTAESY